MVLFGFKVLQKIPFDDPVLTDADNDGLAGLDDQAPDYGVQSADFTGTGVFSGNLGGIYTVVDDTNFILTDAKGKQYTVFWNVADVGAATSGQTKVFRLFVSWNGMLGGGSSVLTAVKYRNIELGS